MILGTAAEYVERWAHLYQEANARHGRQLQLGENLGLGLWCYMDETHEKAKRALQPMFEEHVKFAAPLGMLRYNDQQMAATDPGGVARHIAAGTNFEEVLEKQAWFCGTPAETVAYLQEIEARYSGLEHVLLGFPMGASLSQFQEQLACFAHKAMPAFKKTAVRV